MSFLSGLFGDNGSNFIAKSADVVSPLSGPAYNSAVRGVSDIDQQRQLAQLLGQQGGIQNQSNIYNQLGQVAAGQGPNPAQAMLAQQTGQNVANQAALMAGQRGASSNPALIARQAAQQGAATQQQAIGQGASLQAQQSLNALGQQAGIAGQQVNNQMGQQNAVTTAQQNEVGQFIGANNALNQANIQNTQQQNAANAGIAQGNQKGQQDLLGNLMGAVGSGAQMIGGGGKAAASQGGIITPEGVRHHYDIGGVVDYGMGGSGPQSSFAQSLNNPTWNNHQAGKQMVNGIASLFRPSLTATATPALNELNTLNAENATPMLGQQGGTNLTQAFARGGKVQAMVSPGEKIIPPEQMKRVEQGKKSALDVGKTVGGKAKVEGDSLENDTVPKDIEAGSVVLPRSVTHAKNPTKAAHAFVEALLKKQGRK